jgi:hypothetical protein
VSDIRRRGTVRCATLRRWGTHTRSVTGQGAAFRQLGNVLRRSSGSDGPFAIYRYRSPSIAYNRKRSIGVVRHRSKRSPYPSKRPFTIDRSLSRSSRLLDQVHHDAAKSNRATLRVLDVSDAAFPRNVGSNDQTADGSQLGSLNYNHDLSACTLKIRRRRSSDLGLLLEN